MGIGGGGGEGDEEVVEAEDTGAAGVGGRGAAEGDFDFVVFGTVAFLRLTIVLPGFTGVAGAEASTRICSLKNQF